MQTITVITVTTEDGTKLELPEPTKYMADAMEHGPTRVSVEWELKRGKKDKLDALSQVWPGKGTITVTAGEGEGTPTPTPTPEPKAAGEGTPTPTPEPGEGDQDGALFEGTVTGVAFDDENHRFGLVAMSEADADQGDDGHGEPGGCDQGDGQDDDENDQDNDEGPVPGEEDPQQPDDGQGGENKPAPGEEGEPSTEPGPDGEQQ